ncbi:hypothetical protein RG836_20275 [Pseudomonas sp. SZMC_28357]|uniref:hypothetical protein n=1 Tax=Pseudomonas sp. SZMC_28357 TaxID=3074380 RepID=UPI0028713253|nr:hypothetical protein [Pseudomonas sp. SZMC_28357]MDR9753790.1 hypothetical protein [Pseudomonas sp. SZMC_28357]
MKTNDRNTTTSTNAPPTDSSGQPVNVVERDLEDRDGDTEGVDKVITPSSTRTKEQDAEELQRKTAEIERKVADGN